LHELGAEQFPARVTGDERVALPARRPERRMARVRSVETEAARRLVLRAVVEEARLVDHFPAGARRARGGAVVPSFLNMEELVEGVAVGEPGRPLLVGREELAGTVEVDSDREADSGAEDPARAQVGGELEDRAALAREPVVARALRVDEVGVGVVAGAEPETNTPVPGARH